MSIGTVNYGPLASKQVPAWQARRRNRSTMPRPKSTGYLKDFNILSEEDDIEDVGIIQASNIVQLCRGRRGRDRMVVGFTTTYAISDYHH